MEIFSHLLWSYVIFRNKLWREEALFFAILPDVSFLLIILWSLFGTPIDYSFREAVFYMPHGFRVIYHLLHSFVTLAIVVFIVWKLKPKLLMALSGWFVHICMDIPFHDGEFGTRFLYPILPDFYIKGVPWTDYRVLAVSYFALLIAYVFVIRREWKKQRKGDGWKPDWIDKFNRFAGGLINPDPIQAHNAKDGDYQGTSEHVSGEDQDSHGQGQDSAPGTVP